MSSDKSRLSPENIQIIRNGNPGTSINVHYIASPLLDHFTRSASSLLGVTNSEFIRRVMMDCLERWQAQGLYAVPEQLLRYSRKQTSIRIGRQKRTIDEAGNIVDSSKQSNGSGNA